MKYVCMLFLWLIIYSFVGWAYESTLCSITGGKPVNRGFLNGPICPVYGFGALAVILLFYPLRLNPFLLFVLSAIVTTALEYLTAVLLEKLFKTKWWDYSNYRFNFQGRVSLLGAFVFGALSVIIIEFVHPFILDKTGLIPDTVLYIICGFTAVFLAADITVTVWHIISLNGKLREIQLQLNDFIDQRKKQAEGFKATIIERFEASEFYNERMKKLFEHKSFQDRRLMRAFPKMKSLSYNDALNKIREKLNIIKKS